MKRTTYAVLVVALLVVSTLLLVPGQALADVPTKASSTWQTNGIVYAVAYARGNVYIGGAFTSVRPPGAAPGTGEVARNHLAAFNATTGALLSFNHNANATVYSLEPSPDKTRLYAGGDFTGTLYVGGTFGNAGGQARTNLAAFTSAGALLPFRATPDASVRALIASADGSRIVIGGSFDHVNGVARRALAILDTSGAVRPQQSSIPRCTQVTSFARTATVVFLGGEGSGAGCFDGTVALNPTTGAQLWRDNCLGATQAVQVIGTWLYVGSHAHNCSSVVGGFGETFPAHHLMRENVSNGHIDPGWFPNTSGNNLGPRSLGTDGVKLGVGGDFHQVNNKPQQGFTQFG